MRNTQLHQYIYTSIYFYGIIAKFMLMGAWD